MNGVQNKNEGFYIKFYNKILKSLIRKIKLIYMNHENTDIIEWCDKAIMVMDSCDTKLIKVYYKHILLNPKLKRYLSNNRQDEFFQLLQITNEEIVMKYNQLYNIWLVSDDIQKNMIFSSMINLGKITEMYVHAKQIRKQRNRY